MSEMHSVKECFRVGKVKIFYKEYQMEWIIASLVFIVLAKKGLRAQHKSVDVKSAAAAIAANITLEIAELAEIGIQDTSAKNSKKP